MTAPDPALTVTAAPDLGSWLHACYDAAERLARAATPGSWRVGGSGEVETVAQHGTPGYERPWRVTQDAEGLSAAIDEADAVYVAAHDPSWRLADIALKRQILAEHEVGDFCLGIRGPCRTLRLLAAEFAAVDGYQEGWKP